MKKQCYHCNQPLLEGSVYSLPEQPVEPLFCCPACLHVYQYINNNELGEYYRRRTVAAEQPDARELDFSGYDDPDYQARHFERNGGADGGIDKKSHKESHEIRREDSHEGAGNHKSADSNISTLTARFLIDDMHCSACAWLIERRLRALPGVRRVAINLQQKMLLLKWDQAQIPLSQVLQVICDLGYRPLDWNPSSRVEQFVKEKKFIQTRLGVAGLLMMQVGMLSIGLYAGDWQSMDIAIRDLLRAASALLSLVALIYSGGVFFRSAWNSLRSANVNMDVPVSIALALTWAGSVYAMLFRQEHVYFDTVTMFIFLLLLSRFLEVCSRDPLQSDVASTVPAFANRVLQDGSIISLPTSQLKVGDYIRITAGDALPVDGILVSGSSQFDESLFSGESKPLTRIAGDTVYAATINTSQPVDVEVTATGRDCAVYQLERLAVDVDAQKPAYARTIDRFSPWFTAFVLLAAALTGLFWWLADVAAIYEVEGVIRGGSLVENVAGINSSKAFMAVIAVLVAACPCALSLATPVAFSTANQVLRQIGILPKSSVVLERVPSVDHIVFDKTGTLTRSDMSVQRVNTFGGDALAALRIAASLEAQVLHPVAKALCAANKQTLIPAESVQVINGLGVEGVIAGERYRLGKPGWSLELYQQSSAHLAIKAETVVLTSQHGAIASFDLSEELRPEAAEVVGLLKKIGCKISISSGDCEERVRQIANQLGISDYFFAMKPEQKLAHIKQLQQQGSVVMMVGDGLNDVPVMAAADVSVAVASASMLNQNHADALLLKDDLRALLNLAAIAKAGRKTVIQNIVWAVAYNSIALPLAMAGLLPPWLAALGMSLSSLIVVMNSRRAFGYWKKKSARSGLPTNIGRSSLINGPEEMRGAAALASESPLNTAGR